MKPICTIHAGEYLVGEHLEKRYSKNGWRIWTPGKDTGIDLLVTSADCRKTFSIQVKFSKSYPQKFECDASGWWNVKRDAIAKSDADCWVFVFPVWPRNMDEENATRVLGVEDCRFVVIDPEKLLKRLELIHPDVKAGGTYKIYLTQKGENVLETREIKEKIEGVWKDKKHPRNLSAFLDNWEPLETALQ